MTKDELKTKLCAMIDAADPDGGFNTEATQELLIVGGSLFDTVAPSCGFILAVGTHDGQSSFTANMSMAGVVHLCATVQQRVVDDNERNEAMMNLDDAAAAMMASLFSTAGKKPS